MRLVKDCDCTIRKVSSTKQSIAIIKWYQLGIGNKLAIVFRGAIKERRVVSKARRCGHIQQETLYSSNNWTLHYQNFKSNHENYPLSSL